MEKKKMRRRLFGFKKKDVNTYIAELVNKYEAELEAKSDECNVLKKQNKTLVEENAEIFAKLTELENEREYVSKAVISAEVRAKKVKEDTEEEMATLKANKMAEIAIANEELEKLRQQINALKLSAVATLREYENQMGNLVEDK